MTYPLKPLLTEAIREAEAILKDISSPIAEKRAARETKERAQKSLTALDAGRDPVEIYAYFLGLREL